MTFAPQLSNSSNNIIDVLWLYSNSPHKILKRLVEFELGHAEIMPIATTMIRRIIRTHLAARSAAGKSFATLWASNDLFVWIFWIVDLFIFQVLRHGSAFDSYHIAAVNLHKNSPAIRFVKKIDANQSIKLCLDRLIVRPLFFDDAAVNQLTSVLVDHFGGHFLAADLPLDFGSVVLIAHNRNTRAKPHRVQFIGDLLIGINMSSTHFKKFYNKFRLILIGLQNRAPTIFRIHLDTAKTIVRTAHPITELGVTNFRTDHSAHNVAHLIFGAFRFQIFRLLRRIKLTPVIFEPGMLKSINLLLTDNTIHIFKGNA